MERRREKRLFVGREDRREREREEGGTQSSNQLVHFLIPATRWNSIKLAKLEGKTGNSVGRFPPVPLSSSSVGSSLRVK